MEQRKMPVSWALGLFLSTFIGLAASVIMEKIGWQFELIPSMTGNILLLIMGIPIVTYIVAYDYLEDHRGVDKV